MARITNIRWPVMQTFDKPVHYAFNIEYKLNFIIYILRI